MKFLLKMKSAVLSVFAFSPVFASAAGLVNCDPSTGVDCTISSLFTAISNGIDWIIVMAGPIAALAAAWAGVKYLTAGGDMAKIKDAHKIFWSVIVGFVIILSAWLVVKFILTQLGVDSSFIRLG